MTDPKSVLVVDDDPDMRKLVSLTMQSAGYRVTQAENGREALETLADAGPDLILLDMMMPQMNGVEFCRALVEGMEGDLDIAVMIMSAVSEKAHFMREFEGMPITRRGFIRKPFDLGDLVAKAEELLNGPPVPMELPPQSEPPRPAKTSGKSRPPAPAKPAPPRSKGKPKAEPKPEPKAPPPAPARAKAAEPAYSGPRLRVMIIDDDDDIRAVLQLTLSEFHEVREANSGKAALAAIDAFDPDFVISDYEMPGMTGLETVAAIRKKARFKQIPVFFLTGTRSADLPKQAFEAGGNLFLRKPMEPSRLLKIIEHFVKETGIVSRQRLAPQAVMEEPEAPEPAERPHADSAVRILIVESDSRNETIMKDILRHAGRPEWEVLWSSDPRAAAVNLPHWEPDAIFYDPRNQYTDGIAFVQALKIKKLVPHCEFAFIGTEFFKADIDYSHRMFGRGVIKLDQHEKILAEQIVQVVEAAAAKAIEKHFTLSELLDEDKQEKAQKESQKKQVALQRDYFREKFSNVQKFIDEQSRKS